MWVSFKGGRRNPQNVTPHMEGNEQELKGTPPSRLITRVSRTFKWPPHQGHEGIGHTRGLGRANRRDHVDTSIADTSIADTSIADTSIADTDMCMYMCM